MNAGAQHSGSVLSAPVMGVNGTLWDLILHLEMKAVLLNDLRVFFQFDILCFQSHVFIAQK